MSGLISGATVRADALVKPFGIALDEKGNLCLTDTGVAALFYCDFVRKRWLRFNGSADIQFVSPVAVACKRGVFYVADSELRKVFAFREERTEVFQISEPLERPAGLALAGDKLFVADSQAHLVRAFDLNGHFRFQFGERGSAPGEFNFPTHISSDASERLYVSDSMNARIQVFDANGKFLRAIGSPGDTSGHFGRPKGTAVDNAGRVYVVDALFDNVQAFDDAGRLLLDWGAAGSAPGEFWLPNGIAVSAANRIFVTDTFNHRVQVFDYVGKP